jgi:hypothetical protein
VVFFLHCSWLPRGDYQAPVIRLASLKRSLINADSLGENLAFRKSADVKNGSNASFQRLELEKITFWISVSDKTKLLNDNRAKQKTRERQRQQFIPICPVNCWESKGRQPLWDFAQQLHPARVQAEPARSHNAAHHHEQRHGFVL